MKTTTPFCWSLSSSGLYGDSTNEMNYAVGNLVDLVEDLGLKENTLVIFLSDNGPYLEMCSEAGYEGALRGIKTLSIDIFSRLKKLCK